MTRCVCGWCGTRELCVGGCGVGSVWHGKVLGWLSVPPITNFPARGFWCAHVLGLILLLLMMMCRHWLRLACLCTFRLGWGGRPGSWASSST